MTLIQSNCIEFPFTSNYANLATNTTLTFGTETLYIPETTTRTFRSVVVEVTAHGNPGQGNTTSIAVGIKLGAAATSTTTNTVSMTGSGEDQVITTQRDVTSYFTTNFGAGATQTCAVTFLWNGNASANHSAKVIITYDADYNGVDTRVKTVRIPLESITGDLTATATEIGTNQVPALDTFLPEATKVYRQIWFEVEGNSNEAGTTTAQMGLTLDSGSEELDLTHDATSDAGNWFKRIWRPTVADTSIVHAVKARMTDVTSLKFAHLAVKCYVTYEYSHTSSTSFIQSLVLPMGAGSVDISASGDKERFEIKNFLVPDPATVTLAQSGVQVFWYADAGQTVSVAMGGQAARGYVAAAATADYAPFTAIQRVDSGSAQGAGVTVARGSNTFTLDVYTNLAAARGVSAVLYLNYTCAKATNGDKSHSHSNYYMVRPDPSVSTAAVKFTSTPPVLVETNYWMSHTGYVALVRPAGGNQSNSALLIAAERGSGEGPAAGWVVLGAVTDVAGDAEIGLRVYHFEATHLFKQYPADPRYGRMDVETTRDMYLSFLGTTVGAGGIRVNQTSLGQWVTYHTQTWTWAGVLSSATNSITVNLHDTTDGSLYDTVVTSGAGNYSFTVYDNVLNKYAEAKESGSLLGRSDNDVGA